MELYIKATGTCKLMKEMEWECKYGRMGHDMKGFGRMTRLMVRDV
jgi:hypothetical protein